MYTIVAVLGDYYHQAEVIRTVFQEAVTSVFGGKDAVQVREVDAAGLPQVLAERPDAVVLFKENRTDPEGDKQAGWMTEAVEQAIEAYVCEGGGWLSWHSGLASYPADGPYIRMVRGYFISHPEPHELVTYEGEGVSFSIRDEHYFVGCDEAETEVYLRSSSVDGQSIAAWRHAYGQGRVCALTPAHRPDGLGHPEVIRLLGEALSWCCGAGESKSQGRLG